MVLFTNLTDKQIYLKFNLRGSPKKLHVLDRFTRLYYSKDSKLIYNIIVENIICL